MKPVSSLRRMFCLDVSFLKCEAAAGNPLPSYRWFKDGKELNRSRDIRIKYGKGR